MDESRPPPPEEGSTESHRSNRTQRKSPPKSVTNTIRMRGAQATIQQPWAGHALLTRATTSAEHSHWETTLPDSDKPKQKHADPLQDARNGRNTHTVHRQSPPAEASHKETDIPGSERPKQQHAHPYQVARTERSTSTAQERPPPGNAPSQGDGHTDK